MWLKRGLIWVLLPLIVTLVAARVYQTRGLQGEMYRDNGIVLYAGLQLIDGQPPYVGIFVNRGVVAAILSGVGVAIAEANNLVTVYTVRTVFMIASALTVAATYLLGYALFRSGWSALLTAAVFLNFEAFAFSATWGPDAKTPVVLFLTLALFLTVEKRWFWAGVMGAVGTLTWQPVGVVGLATLITALLQSRPKRTRAVILTIIGGALPVVVTTAYYTLTGNLTIFIDALVVFSLAYRELDGPSAVLSDTVFLMDWGYPRTLLPIFLSLWIIGYLYFAELLVPGGPSRQPIGDRRWTVVLLAFPIPFFLTLVDFQSPFDFFLLLPFCAVGLGYLFDLIIRQTQTQHGRGLTSTLAAVMTTVLILTALYHAVESRNKDIGTRLLRQISSSVSVIERLGEDARVMTVGNPESLALIDRTNPNPYLFITAGMDNYINARTENGFAGWVAEVEAWQPDAIIFGNTYGQHIDPLLTLLDQSFTLTEIGSLTVYIRNDRVTTD